MFWTHANLISRRLSHGREDTELREDTIQCYYSNWNNQLFHRNTQSRLLLEYLRIHYRRSTGFWTSPGGGAVAPPPTSDATVSNGCVRCSVLSSCYSHVTTWSRTGAFLSSPVREYLSKYSFRVLTMSFAASLMLNIVIYWNTVDE